jgi:hypothetical protein
MVDESGFIPVGIIITIALHSYITREMNNTPVGGRCSEPYSHPIIINQSINQSISILTRLQDTTSQKAVSSYSLPWEPETSVTSSSLRDATNKMTRHEHKAAFQAWLLVSLTSSVCLSVRAHIASLKLRYYLVWRKYVWQTHTFIHFNSF